MAESEFNRAACEMYGCRPSELAMEDWHTVLRHMQGKAARAKYNRMDAKARADAIKAMYSGH